MQRKMGKTKPSKANVTEVCKPSNSLQTDYNYNTTKMIGWNWRSLNKSKIIYINYLIELHDPDFVIIWETWLDHKPNLIDNRFDIFQTKFCKHQGVCILAKRNKVIQMYTNNEPYIIWVKVKGNKSNYYIIGAYFKENVKAKIIEQIRHLLNRIRKSQTNPTIFLFGDFNMDKRFNSDLIKEKLKLKIDERNKQMITRTQLMKGKIASSTLDLFISTETLERIETLDKASSDHFPILIETKLIAKNQNKKKIIKLFKRVKVEENELNKLLENKSWPTETNSSKNRQLLHKEIMLRPTVKMQDEANKIFNKNWEWESKNFWLKKLANEKKNLLQRIC